jgi:hypothetical protein
MLQTIKAGRAKSITPIAASDSDSCLVVSPNRIKAYWLVMGFVLLLQVWPIWSLEYPSLVDYPSHLAMVQIFRNWNHQPVLQQRYELVTKPFPNLAIEFLGIHIFSGLAVPVAGKISITLLIVFFWAGCHFLGRETGFGRPLWTAPLAALLVYNSTFLYGFVNYNFSIALFLMALPTWLWYRRKRSIPRLFAVTTLATTTYLAHLMGFGVLALGVIFLTALEAWHEKLWRWEFVLDLLPLAPAAWLYASLGHARGDTATIVWGSLALKAKHMLVCFTTYNTRLSITYFLACVIALGIILWKGRSWASSSLLAFGAFLILLTAIFPAKQLFSGSDADARLVVPALAVTLLAMTVTLPRYWARVAFLLALASLCTRIVEIRHYWKAGDALTRAQLGMFRSVPRGVSVFPIVWLPQEVQQNKRERHIWHALEYSTVENLVFLPQLLSNGQQPVMLRDPSYSWIEPDVRLEILPWASIWRDYDFVYLYGVDQQIRSYLYGHCDEVGVSGKGQLYRIRKVVLPEMSP